jgi:beta-lactamase class A
MWDNISRRTVLAAAGVSVAPTALAQPALRAEQIWFDQLERVEAQLGGRVGASAVRVATGTTIGHREDERFAMASTFKALLACCVLDRADNGLDNLDARMPFGEGDLLAHAPVARDMLAEGALSVGQACAAIVEVSDNTAANLLLSRIGGPRAFTQWLRSKGDATTRLDRTEPALNANLPGDARDTTTPRAMRDTIRRLLVEDAALSSATRTAVLGWMRASQTGLMRLRGGLPPSWASRAGDKTGTGARGAVNDVLVTETRWLDGGDGPVVITCFIDAPEATLENAESVHRSVARTVAFAFGHAIRAPSP